MFLKLQCLDEARESKIQSCGRILSETLSGLLSLSVEIEIRIRRRMCITRHDLTSRMLKCFRRHISIAIMGRQMRLYRLSMCTVFFTTATQTYLMSLHAICHGGLLTGFELIEAISHANRVTSSKSIFQNMNMIIQKTPKTTQLQHARMFNRVLFNSASKHALSAHSN